MDLLREKDGSCTNQDDDEADEDGKDVLEERQGVLDVVPVTLDRALHNHLRITQQRQQHQGPRRSSAQRNRQPDPHPEG